ncbi:MAG: glutamine--fructose-6-phosphate transaminase (isomerizing), partial [Myxococcales bacterium]|nr:glutamine--fructose-6-phosphate transaminase (isomerizing) [Myxococcales bacterium]
HLVNAEIDGEGGLTEAVQRGLRKVVGAFAVVVLDDEDPNTLVAVKNAAPLVIGLGEGENFVASDVTAILDETKEMIFIEEGEIVTLTRDSVKIMDLEGSPIERAPKTIRWTAAQAEKDGYRHYMAKEIHEQPRAVADTLAGRVDLEHDTVVLDGNDIDTSNIKRIVMVACGTSYHSSLVGKFIIEQMSRIPVEVDLASEYRYRDPVVNDTDLVIAISQSGETADTMGAVQIAKERGAKVLAISNVLESSIPRLADYAFYTHAGPEIGVASTKAFTTQLVSLTLIAIHLGRQTGKFPAEKAREFLAELVALPNKMAALIERGAQLQVIARRYGNSKGFLFMGRGNQYPIALEGALKLKEISYIHAEGYSAGEMKHGPIALIDENLPVVVLVPKGPLYEKTVSNLTEVRAREGKIIAIASSGDREIGALADEVVMIPNTLPELQPILSVLPLQQLSYYVADYKGTDIDQPRNLAKSVTVE